MESDQPLAQYLMYPNKISIGQQKIHPRFFYCTQKTKGLNSEKEDIEIWVLFLSRAESCSDSTKCSEIKKQPTHNAKSIK